MGVKKQTKKINLIQPIAIDKNMRDYGKDPVIIKKHAEANAFLTRAGLPESFKKHK